MVLVYSLFSAVLGQNGIYARRHLEAELLQLHQNQQALDRRYDEFARSKDSLLNDPDALSVFARQLGYGSPGEEFIRIMGLGVAVNADMPTGQVLYASSPSFVSDSMIKIVSLFVGIAILLYFLVVDFFLYKGIGRLGSRE